MQYRYFGRYLVLQRTDMSNICGKVLNYITVVCNPVSSCPCLSPSFSTGPYTVSMVPVSHRWSHWSLQSPIVPCSHHLSPRSLQSPMVPGSNPSSLHWSVWCDGIHVKGWWYHCLVKGKVRDSRDDVILLWRARSKDVWTLWGPTSEASGDHLWLTGTTGDCRDQWRPLVTDRNHYRL